MEIEYVSAPVSHLASQRAVGKAENKLWKKLKRQVAHKLTSASNYVVFNQRRKAFFFGNDNNVLNFSLKTQQVSKSWSKDDSIVKCFKLRKDGQLAAYSTLTGEAKILLLGQKSVIKSFKLSNQPIGCIDLIDKRPMLAVGGDNGAFEVKDFASETTVIRFPLLHTDYLRKCAFMDEFGHLALTGGQDKRVCLVDSRLEEREALLAELRLNFEVSDIVCCSNDKFVVLANKEVQLWDIRQLDKSVFSSTVGSKTLSAGRFLGGKLFLSSFDGNIRIADVSGTGLEVVNQKNFKLPISGFDLGISEQGELKSIGVATLDGTVRVYNREATDRDVANNDVSDPMTQEERNLYKLLTVGVGPKEMSAFQYFDRGVWTKADDFTVKISHNKVPKTTVYDKHLRKFKNDFALIAALKTEDSTVMLAVIEELMVRGAWKATCKLLSEEWTVALADFLLKKIDSVNSQRTVTYALEDFLEAVTETVLGSSFLDRLLNGIADKVDSELANSERCANILSYIE